MADKKKEETLEEAKVDAQPKEAAESKAKAEEPAKTDEKPKKAAAAKSKDTAKAKPVKKTEAKKDEPKMAESKPAKKKEPAKKDSGKSEEKKSQGKRAEKVGVVWSDKMEKTVVVRSERLVKHRLYHKYMKRRKKFMAHNELGATEGDRVRIVETRPMSARKRWRVVEILQKAEK